MNRKVFFNSALTNKKYLANVFFLILFAWIYFAAIPNIPLYFNQELRFVGYFYLSGVGLFFIHNLLLAPIKFEEHNNRKYIIWVSSCIIIFIIAEVFFLSNLILTKNIFGITPNNLLNWSSLIKLFVPLCIPLLIVAVLSAIYIILIYGFRIFSFYLEVWSHIFILTMIFIFMVTLRDFKTKEISITLSLIAAFYVNSFFITPILLQTKKAPNYLLGLLTLILGYFLIQLILLMSLGLPKFNSETGQPNTRENLPEIIFDAPGISMLIIILFLSFIYCYARTKTKAKVQSLNIKLEEKESELNLLKSQVNPHFLFNTLNTLYATALSENAVKTGTSITKLAGLLRFMQADINKDFIPLENEIRYLQDYIAIQKIRCAIEPQIETQFTNIDKQMISPGLLIPFVENAFKYGINPAKTSKLKVSVVCTENNIQFECINSYEKESIAVYQEQGIGTGISNAKKRLELVYPGNHTFEIKKDEQEFLVKITITAHVNPISEIK